NAVSAFGQPSSAEGYRDLADRAAELVPPAAHADHASQLELLRAGTNPDSQSPEARFAAQAEAQARMPAWLALVELLVFFGVLLVGFAYLGHRGDPAWVRSLAAERSGSEPTPPRVPLSTRQPAPEPLASTHS